MLPREPPALHRPGRHLDPTSYLILVNLQPLKARLLEVSWTGLQGEEAALAFCLTCVWPDPADARPEQAHSERKACRAGCSRSWCEAALFTFKMVQTISGRAWSNLEDLFLS